jgi:hypothetical protein
MDPNLTLAHITHNTAVVLLHQGIAYPSPEWQSMPIKLPSASSAETCLAAAVEVAIIAEEFLRNTTLLTNPQFAFCLFVCGRMLVAHSFYYDTLLPDGFESLVNSLWEMSNRWNGVHSAATTADNLASKFARRLIQARQLPPNTLDILQVAYSEDQAMSSLNTQTGTLDGVSKTGNQGDKTSQLPSISDGQTYGIDQGATPDSITLAFPPLPLAFQAQPSSTNQTAVPSPAVGQLQLAANGYTNQLSNSSTAPESVSLEESSRIGFDDLSSFLDYPFLPNHRVSVFSHPNV